MSTSTNDEPLDRLRRRIAWRHHAAGWLLLLVFVTLGLTLETLHGFKVGFYLDVGHRVRREMWTLAHAHGTLLALVQIAFAVTLPQFGRWTEGRLKLTSFFLLDAAVLIPLGFFLGGISHSEGDPSLGILLVPIGAVWLILAIGMTAWSALRR